MSDVESEFEDDEVGGDTSEEAVSDSDTDDYFEGKCSLIFIAE